MQRHVILLRGINVGGHNKLPMAEFRDLLAELGCENVASYIQSGNAVADFGGTSLDELVADAIENRFGFRPAVMVLAAQEFRGIAAANPYADADVDPRFIHVNFLTTPARAPNLERMQELAADGEQYELTDNACYFLAPNGIGRSKLAAEVEKCLGVPATGRNWRTVGKLLEMLG